VSDTPSPIEVPEGIESNGELDAGDLGRLAWVTHVGHIRSRNEDRLLVTSVYDGAFLLLLVADGAGGHDAGDKAAEMVATTFYEDFPETGEAGDGDPGNWLDATIHKAHERVTALSTGSSRPPASTVVGLLVERASQAVWRFHVGDSRIYARKPDGTSEPWTRDHNIINGLIDRGLPVDQALKIAEGGRLTQVVGGAAVPEVEIEGPFRLEAGITVSITSDGAYAYHLTAEGFTASLDRETGDPRARCDAMQESVLAGPAPDNLTAVLWDVPEELPEPRTERAFKPRTLGGPEDIGAAETLPLKEGWDAGQDMMEPDVAIPSGLPGSSVDDTLDPYDLPEDDPPTPGAGFGTFLAVVLGLFLVIAWLRTQQDDEFPQPVAPPAPVAAVEATPAPTPEATPEESPGVAEALAALDPAWWAALAPEEQEARTAALKALFRPEPLPTTVLTAPLGSSGAPSPTNFDDWPQAGGEGAGPAAAAWEAAAELAGTYPLVAEVPSVAARIRSAACERVLVGWPRVKGVGDDGAGLPDWLAGCLQAEGDTVTVRLGDWPHKGWTLPDLDSVLTAASAPGGESALSLPDGGGNDRIVELGMLAQALGDGRLADLQVEVVVHLPDRLSSPDEPDAIGTAAALQKLLRAAVEGPGLNISTTPIQGDALLPTPEGGVSPAVAARLADLNRRVEVTLFRPGSMELEDEVEEGTPETVEETPAPEPTPEATPAPEPTPEPTPEGTPEATPEATPEPTPAPAEATPAAAEGAPAPE